MAFNTDNQNFKKVAMFIIILLIAFNMISFFGNKINNSKSEVFMFVLYYILFLDYYSQFYPIAQESYDDRLIITTQICDNIFMRYNCILRNIINLVSYLIFFYTLLIPVFQNNYYLQLSYYEQIALTLNFIALPFTLSYISHHDNIEKIFSYQNVCIYDIETNEEKKYKKDRNGYFQV